MWLLGVAINLAGSLSINLSTNLIKLSHSKNYAATADHGPSPKLLRSPCPWWGHPGNRLWLFAIILFAIANIANFASFAFAAQSLLSALGSVQFLSNVAFSRFVNKEPITRWVAAGTAVVIIGCVLLVAFGNHESPTFTARELRDLYSNVEFISYLCAGAVVVVVTYYIYSIGKRRVDGLRGQQITGFWYRWLPICYALFSGIPGTLSVLYGKSISLLLRSTVSGESQLTQWYTYLAGGLFILAAAFWMTRFNKALRLFPVSTMMPVLQVSWVLFSMLSGSLYFQETAVMGKLQISMFVLGALVLLGGVWLLTTSTQVKDEKIESVDIELAEGKKQNIEGASDASDGKKESLDGEGQDEVVHVNNGEVTQGGLSRRSTVAVTVRAGLARRSTQAPVPEENTIAVQVARAVTAPLAGLIW